jgi:hypothetical protein
VGETGEVNDAFLVRVEFPDPLGLVHAEQLAEPAWCHKARPRFIFH